jgi:hypothetical protein
VQALIRTLFEIVMIRKGPDAIPHSWMLFHATAILWLLPLMVAATLVPNFSERAVAITLASWLLSLASFALIIGISGFRARLLQSLSAIIGCGALIFLAQVAGLVFLTPFLGAALVQVFIWLLLIWSVRVKGHIITCTINCERHIGLLIAIAVFVLQYAFATALTPTI